MTTTQKALQLGRYFAIPHERASANIFRMNTAARARLLAAFKQVQAFVQSPPEPISADVLARLERLEKEVEQQQRNSRTLVLALLADDMTPCKLFRPWASVRRFRDWSKAGKLKVAIMHNRCCVRPSEFFAFWRTMPDSSATGPDRQPALPYPG